MSNQNKLRKSPNIIFNFDWEYYISLYEDLRLVGINTKQKALIHWINHGQIEGRTCNLLPIAKLYHKIINEPATYDTLKCNLTRHNVSIFNSNNLTKFITNEQIDFKTKFNEPLFKQLKYISNLNDYDSFILVIDMPNAGGGTTIFMDKLTSICKLKNTILLIARQYKDSLRFFINDEIILTPAYNEKDCIHFLREIKHKISKIFVNHTMGHTINFIQELFLLEKHISIITHDYGLLFNEVQPYIHEIIEGKLERNIIDINKYNCIITQNVNNLCVYDRYLNDNTNIIVSPLPDYYKSLNRIDTNNDITIIGVIGELSDKKGLYVVEKLIEYLKNNNKIEVILFGRAPRKHIVKNQYKYSNINELNNLLIEHKPNILLDASLWPETYSFTLTLAMLTQLPIFYHKKKFNSVVENRLSTYDKAYEFQNIDDLIKNIDHLIKTKQNYFYTIEPILYYNDFWDNYFENKNIPHLVNSLVEDKIVINSNVSDNVIINSLSTYFVYFPQFHEITENNKNYYNKYTDAVNLDCLLKTTDRYAETPSKKDFNLSSTIDYDLMKNTGIIQKQIDLLIKYNMSGFAMYYYWFSINTITNNNTIMHDVINRFSMMQLTWATKKYSSFGQMKIGPTIQHLEKSMIKSKIYMILIVFKKISTI